MGSEETEKKAVLEIVKSSSDDIRKIFPNIPLAYPVDIPKGWTINDTGVAIGDWSDGQEPEFFSSEPFILSRRIIDLEEEMEQWEFTYRHEGKWKKLIEPRSVFSDPRKLVLLSDRSFPVDAINVRKVLEACRAMGIYSRAPVIYSVSTCGWKQFEGNHLFSLGCKILGTKNGEVIFQSFDNTIEKALSSFSSGGTLEDWLMIPETLISKAPKGMLAIYHSLTPPLMKVVGAPNYCVDIAGPSSVGKTTFSRIAASIWGIPIGPGELLKSWNMTKVYGERYASTFNDLPIFLEETQLAKEENQRDYLYMIINGTGRGRGSLKSIQGVKQWNSCLFSTGETPLIASTQLEGARARVISYWGSPFGEKPQPGMVKDIEKILSLNYGHIGKSFIEGLLRIKDKWPDIKKRYEDLTRHLITRLPGHIESRVAAYIALTWVAAELFHDMYKGFFLPDFHPKQIMEPQFEDMIKNIKDLNLWDRALTATIQWVSSNEPSFLKEEGGMDIMSSKYQKEFFGLFRETDDGKKQVCIYPHKLKKFFKEEGYPYESVLRVWKQKGIIHCEGDYFAAKVRVKDQRPRMIVINTEALE